MGEKLILKNMRVLIFNKVCKNNVKFLNSGKFELPNKVPLTEMYNRDKTIGFADNFKQKQDGINCDITIENITPQSMQVLKDLPSVSVGPKLTVYDTCMGKEVQVVTDLEIIEMSIIPNHADESLQGNLYRALNKEE